MTLKERIIGEFLNNELRNYSIYNTNFNKLSVMYDKFVNSIKAQESFEKFLNFERATTADGKIRYDMETDFYDKETKQNVKTKVVFKYPVYRYFQSQYTKAISDIKEKEANTPLPTMPIDQEDRDVKWVNENF